MGFEKKTKSLACLEVKLVYEVVLGLLQPVNVWMWTFWDRVELLLSLAACIKHQIDPTATEKYYQTNLVKI